MVQNISKNFQNICTTNQSYVDNCIDDIRVRLIGCGVRNTGVDMVENFIFPAFMIVYYRQGSVRSRYKGGSVDLVPGTFYVFHPYEIYDGRRLGNDDLSFSYLQFDITPFMERYAFGNVFIPADGNILNNERYCRYGKMLDELATSDLEEEGKPALLRQLAKCIIAQILFDQHNQIDLSDRFPISWKSKLINDTFQYVAKHMDEPIMISEILQELAISKTSLERTFRKVLNCTPQQAILTFKIERAIELLHYGESIKKAAKDLGFSSVYHFSNTFKRITGIRPTEYQEWKKL